MPISRRSSLKFENMNVGVSYRINEEGRYLQDAMNVVSNQGRLETRRGTSRYNSVAMASAPVSLSYYETPSGDKKIISNCSGTLYSLDQSSAHTSIKTGLGATTKHRAVSMNGRHIIACGGLHSWNGTTFTQLGQAIPSSPNASASATGGTLTPGSFWVGYTFYASTIGFETNIKSSALITIAAAEKIIFNAAVPATADNALVDKVRVYLKSGTGSFLFIEEVALGATPANITAPATSTQTPPITHATPPATAKYLAVFNSSLVVAGISGYESDVKISEQDIPDAWDDTSTARVLYASGDGPVMGIATGLYSNSHLQPYLVVFKKRQAYVYSDIAGDERLVEIDSSIGCIAPDSIQTINGNVYFMSESGWRVIIDGRLAQNKGNPVTLSSGAVDDIFNSPGYAYEINKSNALNFHSVYLGREKRYITFISEGPETGLSKAYAYELEYGGFKPYNFDFSITCSCRAENSSGDEVSIFGCDSLYLLKHSDSEDRIDTDREGNQKIIESYTRFSWIQGGDFDSSYNFRQLVVKTLESNNEITLKAWVDYSFFNQSTSILEPDSSDGSFILDVSRLDVDYLSSGRQPTSISADVNRRGKNIAIGFYQSILGANLGIISMQLDFSKNGNRN